MSGILEMVIKSIQQRSCCTTAYSNSTLEIVFLCMKSAEHSISEFIPETEIEF